MPSVGIFGQKMTDLFFFHSHSTFVTLIRWLWWDIMDGSESTKFLNFAASLFKLLLLAHFNKETWLSIHFPVHYIQLCKAFLVWIYYKTLVEFLCYCWSFTLLIIFQCLVTLNVRVFCQWRALARILLQDYEFFRTEENYS